MTPLKTILPAADMQKLFSNISIIHKINETLLNQLESRFKNFNPKKTLIGDVFINIIPFLGVYCDYCCNYEAAVQFASQLKQYNMQFASFIQATSEYNKGYGLSDLLIMPVQRIPRYKLLLDKLIKYTSESHPDYDLLNKAHDLVSDKATDINKKMNIVTQQKVMMQLHTRFLSSYQLPGGLVQPWRHHICQINARWIRPFMASTMIIEFFIFNDIFIISTAPRLSEEKFECIVAHPLWNSFILKPDEDWKLSKVHAYSYQVVNPAGTWFISFGSEEDYSRFKTQFETAREDYLSQANEKKIRRSAIKIMRIDERQEYIAIEPITAPLPPIPPMHNSPLHNPPPSLIEQSNVSEDLTSATRTPKKSKLSRMKQEQHSKTISPKKIVRKEQSMTLKFPLSSKKLEDWNRNCENENHDNFNAKNSKLASTPSKYSIKSGSTNSSPFVSTSAKKKRTKSTKMTPLKVRE